jgi:hypothetical protein
MNFTRASCFLLLTFVAMDARVAAGQQPAPSSLDGIIVDATPGAAPIGKVTVEVRSLSGTAIAETQTDSEGAFYFPRLPAAEYRVIARRPGYVTSEYGQRRVGAPAMNLTITPGQRQKIQLVMSRAGAISGRLTENGRPVSMASVVALQAVNSDSSFQATPVLSALSNDLGDYHIFWLPPGRYYIIGIVWDSASGVPHLVTPDGDDSDSFYSERRNLRAVLNRAIGAGAREGQMHVPIYYPGTSNPSLARMIDVAAGSENRNVDFDVSMRSTARVRGFVTGLPTVSPGAPAPRVTVRLVATSGLLTTSTGIITDGIAPPWEALSATVAADGAFEIPRVVTGSYTLMASAGSSAARFPIEVPEGNLDNVTVRLSEGTRVTGRVVVSDVGTTVNLASLRVVLRSDPPMLDAPTYTSGPISADGTFSIPQANAGVLPGTYRVWLPPILNWVAPSRDASNVAAVPPTGYVKAIVQGQTDVLSDGLRLTGGSADPLIITLGASGGIQGRVSDGQGRLAAAVWVALVPEGVPRFRTAHKFTLSDASGRFQILSVPAGDYRAYAWTDITKDEWQNPAFIARSQHLGAPVRISESANTTVDLTAHPTP